jgi:hypothetical protein
MNEIHVPLFFYVFMMIYSTLSYKKKTKNNQNNNNNNGNRPHKMIIPLIFKYLRNL